MASKNNSTPLRILFLARRYPPSVGGIQTHCYNLYHRLIEMCSVKLVALGRDSLLHLMWFVPYCFLVSLFCILFRRVDAIYFSDGVVCSIAPFLRLFTRMRFVVTIYGLEMTYSNPIFSRMMRFGVSFCDKVSVISQITRAITIQAGVPVKKIEIIYLGIDPPSIPEAQREALKARFEAKHGIQFGRDKIVLNFGRQVPRKGVAKFLECGVPLLDRDIKLIISGSGPDAERIREIWKENDLQDRVLLLYLSDEELGFIRREADLFIMPNVPYPNDVEGFGITHLECMYDGTPVVAFAVDALTESVSRGGYLIPPNDYQAFVDQVHAFFQLSATEREQIEREARDYVRSEFTWDKTAVEYKELFYDRC
jgi:glycosyltransferase involved in cell wall biosynthesis